MAIQATSKLTKVVVEEINGGYRYHGITKTGEKVELRKKATRRYARAFFYPFNAGPGKGLAAQFTYGKNPASHLRGSESEVFVIEDVK